MDFLQKLDFMMKKNSLNKRTLSQNSGIPYTTIDGWYKKGYEGMKISTLRILSSYFNTMLDFWFQEEITDPNYGKCALLGENFPISDEAVPEEDQAKADPLRSTLLRNFDQLNQEGRERLVETSDDMVSSGKYIKSNPDKLGSEKYA